MNVTCPVNFTSYGLCGLNVLRALDRAGASPAWWPIGDTQAHRADADFLAELKGRQAGYDPRAASLRLYHDFDLAQHVGRGKRVAYTIFELDRFTPRSLHQLLCQDAVAVPSRWAASVLPDVEKHVVPLGIDRSIFFPRPMPGPGPTTFLTVGKWERRKGHDVLLQAFERAFSPSDDVRLVLACANHSVPGGPERMAAYNRGWEDYYRTSRLASKVTLAPRLGTQAELAALMASADCGVFLSRAEGWCALPGTVVDTEEGSVPIESVKPGQKVFTHKGLPGTVTRSIRRPYSGDVVSIRVAGVNWPMRFTPEHRHYISTKNTSVNFSKIPLSARFVDAGSLKRGDFWVVPKLSTNWQDNVSLKMSAFVGVAPDDDGYVRCKMSYKGKPQPSLTELANEFSCSHQMVSDVLRGRAKNLSLSRALAGMGVGVREVTKFRDEVRLTRPFMFLLGHYLAEGWAESCKVGLATHGNERWGRARSASAIKSCFGLLASERFKGGGCRLTFNSSLVSKLLVALCGKGAKDKFIHPVLKESSFLAELIRGYFYGDGCWFDSSPTMTTVSHRLARDVVECLNRLEIFSCVRESKRARRSGSTEYVISVPSQYSGKFWEVVRPVKYNHPVPRPVAKRAHSYAREDEKAFYLPIRSVSRLHYSGDVYNLSVEGDESYTTWGYATHNCMPLSEMLAMGRPAIATFVTAHTEYLTQSNALLVQCPDTEEAHDGVWFTGQGRWASLGDGEIAQAAEHMRAVHEDKRRGRLAANDAGARDMERYTWDETARGLLAC